MNSLHIRYVIANLVNVLYTLEHDPDSISSTTDQHSVLDAINALEEYHQLKLMTEEPR